MIYQYVQDVVLGKMKIEDVPEGQRAKVRQLASTLKPHQLDPYGRKAPKRKPVKRQPFGRARAE